MSRCPPARRAGLHRGRRVARPAGTTNDDRRPCGVRRSRVLRARPLHAGPPERARRNHAELAPRPRRGRLSTASPPRSPQTSHEFVAAGHVHGGRGRGRRPRPRRRHSPLSYPVVSPVVPPPRALRPHCRPALSSCPILMRETADRPRRLTPVPRRHTTPSNHTPRRLRCTYAPPAVLAHTAQHASATQQSSPHMGSL